MTEYQRSSSFHRSSSTLLVLLLSGVAFSQVRPIDARFEPRCDVVMGYFAYSGTNAVSYAWNFGDGGTSTLATPAYAFPFGTTVTVTLTVVDQDGESTTFVDEYRTQDQLEFSQIEFPNVFTPNGDGVNDEFVALNNELLGPCSQLQVYNRYGQLLFESLGNNVNWDGRSFAGEPASAGVYFYVFTWGAASLNSTVTLVR